MVRFSSLTLNFCSRIQHITSDCMFLNSGGTFSYDSKVVVKILNGPDDDGLKDEMEREEECLKINKQMVMNVFPSSQAKPPVCLF